MTAKDAQRLLRTPDLDDRCRGLLICLAHAGAGASSFNGWTRQLPDWLGLVRAQLPGREDLARLPARRNVHDIVALLRPEVGALPPVPIALYGHSLGAIVAFELAREMRRAAMRQPVALYVSGRRGPRLPLSHAALYTLPDDELLHVFQEMGAPSLAALDKPAWRDAFFAMVRADLEVSDAYRYTADAPLDCPIHAFHGERDLYVAHDEMAAWGEESATGFRLDSLSGRHFFDAGGRDRLIETIVGDLERRMALEATT